jgi:dUTP pyrophosphatase
MKPLVKFIRLPHFCGESLKYQTPGSSGCDVAASIPENLTLNPGKRLLVPTGLKLEIPTGFEIQVRPRSGLAFKNGVTLVNTPGTIDSDYRGELKIILINLGDEPFVIKPGDRIAQLVVMPVTQARFEEVKDLEVTERGIGGFGSTGV